ncbi:hypothetical protein F4604DRAFT_1691915 [Suillus subluteus]|nr:hypothetical protein F4604DRAFT_1691915 [Suillus subluteus]
MVRTVRKSGKSTGGPAKRGALPGPFKHVPGPCGEQVIKMVFVVPRWRFTNVRMLTLPTHNICPGCHEVRDRDAGKGVTTPYFGFEDAQGKAVLATPAAIHGHIELTSRSEVCTLPILILNFVLDGVDAIGSPARTMRDGLHSYVTADYYEIVFDVGTTPKFNRHAKAMAKLSQEIGPRQFARVEVFVHSHSDTNRGDLWVGFETSKIKGKHGEPVAYSLDNFFTAVFPSSIAGYLKGSTLWMLVCGHMLREIGAFNDFKACVRRHGVQHAFAFGAERFYACIISPFIFAYVERVLVEGFEVEDTIEDLLKAAPRLGMHTSITHVRVTNTFCRRPPTVSEYNKGVMRIDNKAAMIVTTYKFFQETQRPWGNPLPYQCICTGFENPCGWAKAAIEEKLTDSSKKRKTDASQASMAPRQSKKVKPTQSNGPAKDIRSDNMAPPPPAVLPKPPVQAHRAVQIEEEAEIHENAMVEDISEDENDTPERESSPDVETPDDELSKTN